MNTFKKAFITGASSGIGRDIALLLADKGVALIVHGRDARALQTLVDEIGTKTTVKVCIAELANHDGIQNILSTLQEEFPDLVINCAGFGLYGDFVDHGPHEIQEMIATNCAALVAICQHVSFWWKHEKVAGTILNVSSVLGLMPTPGASIYGATKAFVNSFSEALDVELEAEGIRVLTACPGRVATNFAHRASKGKIKTAPQGGMVLDSKLVAQAMVDQIENKKPLQVIDWKYRLFLAFTRLLPRRYSMKRLYKSLKARSK